MSAAVPAEATSEAPSTSAMKTYAEWAYVALRIVAGLLMVQHGVQKVAGVLLPPDHIPPVGSQMWVGGVLELVGGALIAAGLFTRVAAFLLSGQMAVAYFQFHWKLAFGDWQWLPVVNHGDEAVLFCFLYLYLVFAGPGRASLDRLVRRVQ